MRVQERGLLRLGDLPLVALGEDGFRGDAVHPDSVGTDLAVAAPMPRELPVTKAILSFNVSMLALPRRALHLEMYDAIVEGM